MTREQADKWARVCANLTDDLPTKINAIGKAISRQMAVVNKATADGTRLSTGLMDGMIDALMFLGVPCQAHKDGDAYRDVEIAGETFRVNDSSDADAENGEQESE